MSGLALAAFIALALLQVLSTLLIAILLRRQHKFVKAIAKAQIQPPLEQSVVYPVLDGVQGIVAAQAAFARQPHLANLGAASPQSLLAVAEHITHRRPHRVLECGAGPSTIFLASMLKETGGRLVTLEDHEGVAKEVSRELEARGLADVATVVPLRLKEMKAPDLPQRAFWYDLSRLPDELSALRFDLVAVNRQSRPGLFGRYFAGPELLPRLSEHAHVFVDGDSIEEEGALSKRWRKLYPDLGVREIDARQSVVELFFLDRKIEPFLAAVKERGSAAPAAQPVAQPDNGVQGAPTE